MYSYFSRVRFSECDANGSMKLTTLVDYLQDTAIFHSEDVGYTVQYMLDHHMAWLLASWQIVIHRMPVYGEKIETITNPYAVERFIGYRNFKILGNDGEECVIANSVWALMDLENGKPITASEDMINAYQAGEKFQMNYAPRKIKIPEVEFKDGEPFAVEPWHLDSNRHVNNGAYIHMAWNYVPRSEDSVGDFDNSAGFTEIRAEYKNQGHLGDIIYPKVAVFEEGRHMIVDLRREDGKSFAVVEFL